jgi:hypothetical protein
MHSTLISELQNYQVCQACGIVDKDKQRIKTAHPCSNCKTPSTGGLMFFNLETQMLADLISETWKHRDGSENNRHIELRIIIFYCTLQEILMHRLLEANMWAAIVPEKLIDKTLSDNRFISKRVNSLFPVLTGKKFRDAVIEMALTNEMGEQIMEIWQKAIYTRNNFMHRGDQWGIPNDLPKACWNSVLPLCDIFVRLTNKYATKNIS